MTCETEKLVAMMAAAIEHERMSQTASLQLLGALMRLKQDHAEHTTFTREAIAMNEKWSAVTVTLLEGMAKEARETMDDRSSQRLRRMVLTAREQLTKPLPTTGT